MPLTGVLQYPNPITRQRGGSLISALSGRRVGLLAPSFSLGVCNGGAGALAKVGIGFSLCVIML